MKLILRNDFSGLMKHTVFVNNKVCLIWVATNSCATIQLSILTCSVRASLFDLLFVNNTVHNMVMDIWQFADVSILYQEIILP